MNEVKQYLRSSWNIQNRILSDQKELCWMISNLGSVKAMDYSKVAVQGGTLTNPLEETVLKIVDREKKLSENIALLFQKMDEIKAFIASLEDGRLEAILRYRYIEHQTWERIAVNIHYSWPVVHKLHAKALRILAEKH